jgi:hypothetical protein
MLHAQALLKFGACGTEVTEEKGDCENVTTQTVLTGTTVTVSLEHNGCIKHCVRVGNSLSTNKRQSLPLSHRGSLVLALIALFKRINAEVEMVYSVQ